MRRRPPVIRLALTLALTIAPATAQQKAEPPPADKVTILARGPLLRASFAGPKSARLTMLPTNFGALLNGVEWIPMWTMLYRQFRDALDEADSDDARPAWIAVEKRLLGYGGRVDLEIHLVPLPDKNKRAQYDMSGHLLLWSDGKTDMAALGEEVRKFCLAVAGDAPRFEVREGDHAYEAFGSTGGNGVTLPTRYRKEHLVVFFGNRIDTAVTRQLALLAEGWPEREARAKTHAPGALASAELDMRQVARLSGDNFRKPEDGALVRRITGMDTWHSLRLDIRTAGPHLQIEASADFLPGKRGIFAAFVPDIAKLPDVAFRVPAGTRAKPPAFAAGHVRWNELYAVIVDFVANFRFFGGKAREVADVKTEINKEAGFDIEADLLAHIGTEVLLVANVTEAADDQDRAAPDADGLCFALQIVNRAAFAKTFRLLTEHRNLRPGEPENHDGLEVVPIRFLDRGEYLAMGDGLLYYAVGKRGLAAMKATHARQKEPVGTRLPPGVERTRRLAPPGFNLAGLLPTRILKDSLAEEVLYEGWKEIRGVLPRELRWNVNRQELMLGAGKLAPILAKYRLDRWVLLGGFDVQAAKGRSRARVRIIW